MEGRDCEGRHLRSSRSPRRHHTLMPIPLSAAQNHTLPRHRCCASRCGNSAIGGQSAATRDNRIAKRRRKSSKFKNEVLLQGCEKEQCPHSWSLMRGPTSQPALSFWRLCLRRRRRAPSVFHVRSRLVWCGNFAGSSAKPPSRFCRQISTSH